MDGLRNAWSKVTDGVGQFLMVARNIVATTRATDSGTVDGVAHNYPQPSKRPVKGPPSSAKGDGESVVTQTSKEAS